MPHRGRACIWSDLFDSAQEKNLRIDRTIACNWGNAVGRIERTHKRDSARGPGNRPGLVLARHAFDGADLRATGTDLAAISGTRNVQKRLGFGCGLLHVHASAHTDFIVYGFVARHAGDEIFGDSCSSTFNRSSALAVAR